VAAKAEVEKLLHTSPYNYGIKRARWRLQDVGRALAWLNGYSDTGIYKVLKRLGFSRKRALNFIRSPDPEYRMKWQAVLRAYAEAVNQPDKVVILFLDELTYYRQPSKAPAYHSSGKTQPQAIQVATYNTKTRLVAVMNAITGQVTYMQRSKIGKEALVAFYAQVRAAYLDAEKVYIVQLRAALCRACRRLPRAARSGRSRRRPPSSRSPESCPAFRRFRVATSSGASG